MGTRSSPQAQNRILAIDGPAGAGKSTLAGRMAARFGLLNLETGAMYRAFGLKALREGVALDTSDALMHLSRSTRVELVPGAQGSRVLLDGADVTGEVRTPAVSDAASRVSVHGPVRAWMVRLQQELGRSVPGGIVMEGRDIGTVVFPEASVKIFLVASPEARTERRLAQTGDPQAQASAILAALRERDERDRSRAESPLRPAEDAITLDSTELSLDAVTERVAALVRERWGV
jgi:cytidylate kinase